MCILMYLSQLRKRSESQQPSILDRSFTILLRENRKEIQLPIFCFFSLLPFNFHTARNYEVSSISPQPASSLSCISRARAITMVGFLDLPIEIHYEIASQLLPPLPKDCQVRFPAFAHDPILREFLDDQADELNIIEYDGLNETANLIIAVDISGDSNRTTLEALHSLYTVHLCKFIKAVVIFQHQLFSHLSNCPINIHSLQWKLAIREVQDVFDDVTVANSVNGPEYKFWRTFLTILASDQQFSITATAELVVHKPKQCNKSYFALQRYVMAKGYDEWARLWHGIALFDSTYYKRECHWAEGIMEADETLMEWLGEFVSRGRIVDEEFCSTLSKRQAKTLRGAYGYYYFPDTTRNGLLTALHQQRLQGVKGFQEMSRRALSRQLGRMDLIHMPEHHKVVAMAEVAKVKQEMLKLIMSDMRE
ncbi:hypothetical protein BJ508DRAFT_381327 [Ascobolus immersus RN42]|uniref:Uncharacterized protein n=1 Tax=Ascobolus immersus RN42 TaxID=1160509 RepID=A0A3N4HFF4_ASCIM|nr:hypothetical protein BJ508DRAFT_381327 [Ascobolus immersus RN42]